MNTVKPGYKTTEFWIVVIGNLLNAIIAFKGMMSPTTYVLVTTTMNTVYAILRSLVKQPDITTVVDNSVNTTGINEQPAIAPK